MSRLGVLGLLVLCLALAGDSQAELRSDALSAARKGTTFYWKELSTRGGYLWKYSADLKLREGEGKQIEKTVWVQPPGTPAVGEAYVRLYKATHEKLFLDAALAAADALRQGQLRSGGWQANIEFDPQERLRYAYRLDPVGKKQQRNQSSLDDDKTQSALRFLMQLDQALEFKNADVHEMTQFALEHLLKSQFPNGGFPQVWDDPYDAAKHPVVKASFPSGWPRTYPGHENYWYRYTLNDDLLPDVLQTLLLAKDIYGDKSYDMAIRKVGDFLILAQLPEPQPAWAQQYDFAMQPAWARKFEPPAITGGESQGALRVLMEVYRQTGDKKYLAPIPSALAYLKKSQLTDGRLARFYELETNKPLYFTKEYVLTYDSGDLPTHYSFKVGSKLAQIEREYQKLLKTPSADLLKLRERQTSKPNAAREQEVRQIIDALNDQGAWVEMGSLKYQKYQGPIIDMATAVKNFQVLAEYLAADQED